MITIIPGAVTGPLLQSLTRYDELVTRTEAASCFRKIHDPTTAAELWNQLRAHMSHTWTDTTGVRWQPIGSADYTMMALLLTTQSFTAHRDASYWRDALGATKGIWTALLYLSTVTGGCTRFLESDTRVKPVAGDAVIFDMSLLHQGEPVMSGEKLWVATEFIGYSLEENDPISNSIK
jgi:hypothetical protein